MKRILGSVTAAALAAFLSVGPVGEAAVAAADGVTGTIVDQSGGTGEAEPGDSGDTGSEDAASGETDGSVTDGGVTGDIIVDENSDDVVIEEDDRPYLALGADLTDAQLAVVLSIMGIDPADLGNYDVSYVTNAEEHQYLDGYISSSQIGSKAWSSVLIVERGDGNGLNISTANITYCTVGMYKNALTTAGIQDADIIVAGPSGISGTAALVGVLKAYQEMTGEEIDDSAVDAALNELVVTGELESAFEDLSDEDVEEFVAYVKSVVAERRLTSEEEIYEVIDEACQKYGLTLSDSERQKLMELLQKIASLDIDLDGLVDYAKELYDSFQSGEAGESGVLSAIAGFFSGIFQAVADFFKSLFS